MAAGANHDDASNQPAMSAEQPASGGSGFGAVDPGAPPADGAAPAAAAPAANEEARKTLTLDDIADHFWPLPLVGQHRSDMAFHGTRWAHLLSHVDSLVAQTPDPSSARVLDIGVSLQSELLKGNYPGRVDTLDIDASDIPPAPGEQAFLFDLNDLFYEERWPAMGPYDVIVMCEVIEHLYTAADQVLRGLRSWMAPGGFLFIQTPNAVALHKRVEMVSGKNPYMELSTTTRDSPPHFREYTIDELADAGRRAGLEVLDTDARNYFTGRRTGTALYNQLCERLPPAFRAGLSITYRRPA
jgi:SAM-dependent methyltransferase